MKQIVYTLTLAAGMLASSAFLMADSDRNKGKGHDDSACEVQCELAKETCEKSGNDAACKAAEQKCKQTCKDVEKEADDKDGDNR